MLEKIIAPAALGKDASRVNALIHEIEFGIAAFGRNGLVTNALSALEIAMWDVVARNAGVPLHTMLGDVANEQIVCIVSLNRYDDRDTAGARVKRAAASGYPGVKAHEKNMSVIRAVFEAVGTDLRFMVDVNCGWSVEEADRNIPVVAE